MAILDIFGKKRQPDPFKEDAKSDLPPLAEPQNKTTVLRGAHGRFVSKNQVKPDTKKESVPKEEDISSPSETNKPITVTFYGKDIRKIYTNGKWYFAVEDLISLATSPDPDKPVKMKADFNKTKKEVETTIDNVIYADEKGCSLLITKIDGVFPGPITRWLYESAHMPYVSKPETDEEPSDIPTEPISVNPSDIR